MKVKINLYYDTQSCTVDWRIIAKGIIYTSVANISGNIESSHSFADHKQTQSDAIRFCKLVGINTDDIEFYDKDGSAKPEITKRSVAETKEAQERILGSKQSQKSIN